MPPLFPTITNPRQRRFLLAYVTTGHVHAAALQAHCHRSRHYIWLRQPAYREAFREAQYLGAEAASDELTFRYVASHPHAEDAHLPLADQVRRRQERLHALYQRVQQRAQQRREQQRQAAAGWVPLAPQHTHTA